MTTDSFKRFGHECESSSWLNLKKIYSIFESFYCFPFESQKPIEIDAISPKNFDTYIR